MMTGVELQLKTWGPSRLLFDGLRVNSEEAGEELYEFVNGSIRFLYFRRIPAAEADDLVHETVIAVMEGVKRGEVAEPDRLLGYVRTVARRKVWKHFALLARDRKSRERDESVLAGLVSQAERAEARMTETEARTAVQRALSGLPHLHQEILVRFYLLGQTKDVICQDVGLSADRFRVEKHRAKVKLLDRVRRLRTRT